MLSVICRIRRAADIVPEPDPRYFVYGVTLTFFFGNFFKNKNTLSFGRKDLIDSYQSGSYGSTDSGSGSCLANMLEGVGSTAGCCAQFF
jgi:hypothetical protein